MSLKGQRTTADYIEWDKIQSLILKLIRDKEYKFALLIAIGAYTGLRISDILVLQWKDIIDQDYLMVTEKKTQKFRKIKISGNLKNIVNQIIGFTDQIDSDEHIFLNRFKDKVMSVQYVNRKLKSIAKKYEISKDTSTIKSHSFRKSFGRRVFETNDNSERSLIILSEMFNHTSIKTTKIYLGIREKEIFDVYESL